MKSDSERHVLFNARIHTMDRDSPQVSALVIERGIIIDAGDQEAIKAQYKGTSRFFDLEGRTIIPGLIDAHVHLQHYALSLQRVECETTTREECLRNVVGGLADNPPGEWILGHGWNQNAWPEGFGDARLLDSEIKKGVDRITYYLRFADHVKIVRDNLFKLLSGLKRNGNEPSNVSCVGLVDDISIGGMKFIVKELPESAMVGTTIVFRLPVAGCFWFAPAVIGVEMAPGAIVTPGSRSLYRSARLRAFRDDKASGRGHGSRVVRVVHAGPDDGWRPHDREP